MSFQRTGWIKRDNGLTLRMIISFAVLALLYLIFISVLAYLGVGYIPITIISLLMILAQWYFSDKIVIWSSGAKITTKEQYPKLHDLVEKMAGRSNLPKPKIAVMNSPIPNAFATGKGPRSSVVAVTTGLLNMLDEEELEGVLAHELTHVRNKDVLVLTMASVFSTVAWYLMQFGMFGGMGYGFGGGGRGRGNGGSAMAIVIIVAMITWFASFLIIRAISRYREFAADRGSALMTGKPRKLADALRKLEADMSRVPQREQRKIEALNAFLIIPALSGSSISNLFSTHPPVEKRIQKLLEIEAEMLK